MVNTILIHRQHIKQHLIAQLQVADSHQETRNRRGVKRQIMLATPAVLHNMKQSDRRDSGTENAVSSWFLINIHTLKKRIMLISTSMFARMLTREQVLYSSWSNTMGSIPVYSISNDSNLANTACEFVMTARNYQRRKAKQCQESFST